jgi:hypothetical protein
MIGNPSPGRHEDQGFRAAGIRFLRFDSAADLFFELFLGVRTGRFIEGWNQTSGDVIVGIAPGASWTMAGDAAGARVNEAPDFDGI